MDSPVLVEMFSLLDSMVIPKLQACAEFLRIPKNAPRKEELLRRLKHQYRVRPAILVEHISVLGLCARTTAVAGLGVATPP